jgi:predicted acetyltransferase
MSDVRLVIVDDEDVRLRRLLQLYLYEWSVRVVVPIRPDARFVYDELAHYRSGDGTRLALLFVDLETETPLGFALAWHKPPSWSLEEFFILAGARRRGIGTRAARALFATHPGPWTFTVRPENADALRFWRHVTAGAHEEIEVDKDDGVARTRLTFVA